MLRGGISDKLGNFYEADWAVIEALSVLQGEADEIRLEAFDEDAGGFEFRVSTGSAVAWHQCKRRASGGWTINALEREGILSDFCRKLGTPGAECVFVSSEPATQLKSITEKARLTQTAQDFEASLSKNETRDLAELDRIWGLQSSDRWDRLRRCRLETVSAHSLKRQARQLCRLLFTIDVDHANARILDYLSKHLTHRLTTTKLRLAAEELGLGWRARLDETIDNKLVEATDEYLASLLPPVGGNVFSTPDMEQAVRTAFESGTTGLLIAGSAGSGKSAVLAEIVREARNRGLPVLALRIDRFLTAQKVEEIGEALLGRPENPAGILGNRHGLNPCLFVIDQVDAVSEASGRSGRIRDELFQMLRDAWVYPEVRVVIACRSYDLEHDSRLRKLSESLSIKNVVLQPLDWDSAVAPIITGLGVSREFSQQERRMLAMPINLRLFAEIVSAGEAVEGAYSGSRLFDQLLRIRDKELRHAGVTWAISAALGAIAAYMSAQQDLTAPEQTIADYPGAQSVLASMGLVHSMRGRLQFAHESFFDHVFSGSFVSTGASVLELLLSDQQRLFRRTQVRQIFARLREQAAPRAYVTNLRDVFTSDRVRYLVRDAVASWLSGVEAPTTAEVNLAVGLFAKGGDHRTLARTILSGQGWIQALANTGELLKWIDGDADSKAFAFWILRQGASSHSTEVEHILRNWWSGSQDRLIELVDWFSSLYPDAPIGALETLYGDLIGAYPAELLHAEGLTKHLDLGAWVHGKQAGLAARVLGRWLSRWMEAFSTSHPFERNDNSNRTYWLKELAKVDPRCFLEAVFPPLLEAIQRERTAIEAGQQAWAQIQVPFSEHDNLHVRLVSEALAAVASSDPSFCERLLDLLPMEGDVAIYLHLKGIASNGEAFGHRIMRLLYQPGLFEIGEHGGEWQAFAEAAKAAMPFLTSSERVQLETCVLGYRPEYERAKQLALDASSTEDPRHRERVMWLLTRTGETQRAILRTISPDFLSDISRMRLSELDRKFGKVPLPRAYGIRGGWVESPIKRDRVVHMTDRQWLAAMRKYSGDGGHRYLEDRVVGGASQLAGELRERAKAEPDRFVALLEIMPPETNATYAEAILSGVRESDAGHLAARAITIATRWGKMSATVNWTVQKHPQAGKDAYVLGLVLSSASSGAASDSLVTSMDRRERMTLSIRDLLQGDNDLSNSGLNSERGSAHDALASVLWENAETFEVVAAAIERCVREEALSSVRMMIFHGINSIGKYDAERAAALARELGLKDPKTLLGYAGQHVLRWVAFRDDFGIDDFLDRLRADSDLSVRALAAFVESALALHDDQRSQKFLGTFDDPLIRMVAAYRACGNLGSDIVGDRAEQWLSQLIDDPEKAVRHELLGIEWEDVLDEDGNRADLALAFINSRSFEEESDNLMRHLGEHIDQFPNIAKAAVERVLALMNRWTGSDRQGHWSTLHELGRTLVQLYRTVDGDSAEEEMLLDLFDHYLARDPARIRTELATYERH